MKRFHLLGHRPYGRMQRRAIQTRSRALTHWSSGASRSYDHAPVST